MNPWIEALVVMLYMAGFGLWVCVPWAIHRLAAHEIQRLAGLALWMYLTLVALMWN